MSADTTSALDRPPAAGTDTAAPSDPAAAGAPAPTGERFVLGHEIARGAMGEVYSARDTRIDRDVAVKVLQARLAGTTAERRFAAEARITGQLQHPGIPPVYDLGTLPDGRPYLAMKLIKGDTLAELLAGKPERGRLVAVFEGVCQAVAYAHAHGVIHRDLKPANIMVGLFGEVQVMDWGLAKVLASRERERPEDDPEATTAATAISSLRDDSDHTQDGQALGTPAFMPPEQAIGAVAEVDARSDVFGLGAVLCALLTGKPPYLGADSASTRALAARAKLGDAFARLDACGADPELVGLCKRCLAADRSNRPADAGSVADAVAGLRTAADDRAKRAELTAAEGRVRRRQQLRLGGLAAAILLAGVAAAVVQWRRTKQALDQVTTEQAAKDVALADAAVAQDKTVQALRTLTVEFVVEHLARKPTLTAADRFFLRDVQTLWQAVADTRGDTLEARALRAEGLYRVGYVLDILGRSADAEAAYRTARGLYEQLAADQPAVPAHHGGLADIRHSLGTLLRGTDRLAEAEAEFRAARGLYQRLVADAPDDPVHRADLARAERTLAGVLAHLYRPAEAEPGYQRARQLLVRLAADTPDDPEPRETLAHFYAEYGDLLAAVGRRPEAEELYRLSVGGYERLVADFPAQPAFRLAEGVGYTRMGNFLRLDGRAADALGWYAKAVAALTPAGDYDYDPAVRIQALSDSHRCRASACLFLGRHADAVAEWDRVLALSPPATHPSPRAARAVSLAQCGRVGEAVAEADALSRLPHPWPANDWYNFACIYATALTPPSAAADGYADRAVAMLQKAVAAGFTDTALLATDPDLNPLRGRADFQKVLHSVPELAPPPRPAN